MAGAHAFLEQVERELNASLPPPDEMERYIRETVKRAKANYSERHLRLPEAAFLNGYAIPKLAELIAGKLSPNEVREALLNEYHPSMPWLSCASPARTLKHPFTKVLGASAETIYARWADSTNPSALVQSCPDFALRKPFQHAILFEGKYFASGSLQYAKRALVNDIYQAFFYRGLPFVEATKRGRAAWDYEYACLLAYDASREGTLKSAWEGLPERVRESFWNGANIYVMILGGQGRSKK
jgi:hypothetical protein